LDLLVVGGGIVGAGVARDAAMRGIKTGLVEQHDFAFGTSSRSSRLLHGGLRYLAQGRLRLVHEASVEKKIIHHIAPHLAEPMPFLFPTYREEPDWVLWKLKAGVKLYDLLCGGRNFAGSTWLNAEQVSARAPALTRPGVQGAVRYFDGFTNDSRLTLDTLRSAARHGAAVGNYCRFASAQRSREWECNFEDCLGNSRMKIRTLAVVNATGPWADTIPHSKVKLRLTKGIHLVVHRARLPLVETIVLTEGKRILFAIPWGERSILGTSDTDYSGPPEQVATSREDVEYVLGVANRFFTTSNLRQQDVISHWAGLRPLLADAKGAPSEISRSHEIRMPEPGWWDVAGGKLTTYRLMAEQTLDQIIAWLKREHGHRQWPACRTANEPLLDATGNSTAIGIRPPEFNKEIVEYLCRHEWVEHLDDIMVRRTCWRQYFGVEASRYQQAAEWMMKSLGWSAERKAAEIERFRKLSP
jgi:glycerol-3-phosphate dehydrogenase